MYRFEPVNVFESEVRNASDSEGQCIISGRLEREKENVFVRDDERG